MMLNADKTIICLYQTEQSLHLATTFPVFPSSPAGTDPAEFVLGSDPSCSSTPPHLSAEEAHCNGPLQPDTPYAVQLTLVNDAGFASSRPFIFRTSE